MKVLGPELAARGQMDPKAHMVLGTVKGDVHDIGKNIVGVMLEGGGFSVTDLGVDVPRERFVAAAEDADIIGLSALVSTTMPEMPCVIEALKKEGLRDRVKVMVRGAPVTQRFAQEIGADGYAKDVASAVRVAEELIGVQPRIGLSPCPTRHHKETLHGKKVNEPSRARDHGSATPGT
jgi:5-methyltetrahydrofolate--homocysteine methyltransferase